MLAQQLLDYIRQNTTAGFARADIEKALRAAGWTALDIDNGFNIIKHPQTMPPLTAPSASQTSTEQQAWEWPIINSATESGIIGWLIRRRIVSGTSQANSVLIGLVIIIIILTVVVYVKNRGDSGAPPLTPKQIQEIQHTPGMPATNPKIGH